MSAMLPNLRSIRFEVAQGALGQLLGHVAEQLAIEETKARPDATRLTALETELNTLLLAREALSATDANAIEDAILFYAPRAKALVEATTEPSPGL